MGKKSNSRSRKAPLASFESLMSIGSTLPEDNIMNRNTWSDYLENGNNIDNLANDNEDHFTLPWANPEFASLTQRQKNCEIFRVSRKLHCQTPDT